MGTTWHVTYLTGPGVPGAEVVQAGVEAALSAVNDSMSTYQADSEISRFNLAPVGEVVEVSAGFGQVLTAALMVGQQARGAYDVTVGPLVRLWGFGPDKRPLATPTSAQIDAALAGVGQDALELDPTGRSLRRTAAVELDFSSIAKGFAVDEVANWLTGQGISDFLVEVGGEIRTSGLSGRGDAWRIAIEEPASDRREVAMAVPLRDEAVATSGDYRNFYELDGRRVSHSIDPRTGYPVSHSLVSVTVIAPTAMLADAWATALTVLGAQEGMAVAQEQGLAVYFIERDDGALLTRHSSAFAPYLDEAER